MFLSPGPVLCKLGQPGVWFVLPEVLTPVLGPFFDSFSRAFPSLSVPPPFWTPFPCSTYLTLCTVFQNMHCWRPAQWMDRVEAPKHFPKPHLWEKKCHGKCLVVCCQKWSTTAFWIPAKPLHLKSMLSKSVRCTENWKACSQRQSTEWAQFSTQHLTTCHATSALKVEQIRLRNFVPSAIFTWPLTNWLPLF